MQDHRTAGIDAALEAEVEQLLAEAEFADLNEEFRRFPDKELVFALLLAQRALTDCARELAPLMPGLPRLARSEAELIDVVLSRFAPDAYEDGIQLMENAEGRNDG